MRSPTPVDVDSLTDRIRSALTSPPFRNIWVRGQLEGLKRHTSGHVYFTLLGASARISCAMFRSSAASVLHWPGDGQEVVVNGSLDLYPPRGTYQLIASKLYHLGVGDRARQKELVRRKLEEEGLFDPRLKRPVPPIPSRVLVVTSPSGAALQDVIRVSGERFPQCEILVIPAQVQGFGAPGSIAEAMRRASKIHAGSCVMLVRGGGSRDDLDPFDQEEVARAIRACPYPVVVGVGHQVDTTIADLAADLSAPTPSGAAERVFPDRRELARRVGGMLKLGSSHLKRRITASGARLDSLGSRLKRPLEEAFSREDFRLRSLRSSAASALRLSLERGYGQLRDLSGALEALSPLGVLKRGYAEIQDMNGRKIPCAADLVPGQRVTILFQDGSRPARILGD